MVAGDGTGSMFNLFIRMAYFSFRRTYANRVSTHGMSEHCRSHGDSNTDITTNGMGFEANGNTSVPSPLTVSDKCSRVETTGWVMLRSSVIDSVLHPILEWTRTCIEESHLLRGRADAGHNEITRKLTAL
jgi:hypothetical protein